MLCQRMRATPPTGRSASFVTFVIRTHSRICLGGAFTLASTSFGGGKRSPLESPEVTVVPVKQTGRDKQPEKLIWSCSSVPRHHWRRTDSGVTSVYLLYRAVNRCKQMCYKTNSGTEVLSSVDFAEWLNTHSHFLFILCLEESIQFILYTHQCNITKCKIRE